MSTLKLPPDEFALLRKVIKDLSFPVEQNALRELVREVVREEMAAWKPTAEQIDHIGREFRRQRLIAERMNPSRT